MLFKLEESGFIICVCLILLTSCIIMYYFHTRASMIETSISRQNKVLADFFSTFQTDLRRNTVGGDIHLEESDEKESNDSDDISSSIEEKQTPKSNGKIEVSDDDCERSGIKLVKVSNADSDSDGDESGSDSNLGLLDSDSDLISDIGTDYDDDEEEDGHKKIKGAIIIEDLRREKKESACNSLNIKEILISNNNNNNNIREASAELFIFNPLEIIDINMNMNMKKCTVEEVSIVDDSDTLSSSSSYSSVSSPKKEVNLSISVDEEAAEEAQAQPLKKLKITKLATTTSTTTKEKEYTKKEGVTELRNKAVLLGLVSKEESSKLKKNEILELLKNKNNTTPSESLE